MNPADNDAVPAAPELLSDEILARRGQLPTRPTPVSLSGRFVRLEPLDLARDLDDLWAISNGEPIDWPRRHVERYDADAVIWRYMFRGPFADKKGLGDFLQAQMELPNGLPLCVFDTAHNQRIGAVSFINNVPEHLKIELGNIWYSPVAQRTPANLEATYLMLRHCFDLGYRRVEWKCDALNERSRRSALRMGFTFEAVQRNHLIVKSCNRDTAWFSMFDRDWPLLRRRLENMLAAS